jgi:copper chaperone
VSCEHEGSREEPRKTTHDTILDVDGMTCSSCVRHVEGALKVLDGVGAIEVNVKDGKVRVAHDPTRASVEAMIDALGDAGYESRPVGA